MRLIDADALLQRAVPHGWSTPLWVSDIMIKDAPTIDVEPVRHGHWIHNGFMEVKCSDCRNVFHELEDTNYCPSCGCKMDETE